MKTIVLAEDDSDDREVFSDIFEGMLMSNYQLITFENGMEVLTHLESKSEHELPSLLILDQNMPRLNGKDTVLHLKASPKYQQMPLVIYSTYHDTKFIEDCAALGVSVFLKPDSYEEFSEMIAQMFKLLPKQ